MSTAELLAESLRLLLFVILKHIVLLFTIYPRVPQRHCHCFCAPVASSQGHNITVSMEADFVRGFTPERKSASGFLH